MLTKNDIILRSVVNFLNPFILLVSLFFLFNYPNMGFTAGIYVLLCSFLNLMLYYLSFGKTKTNLFFSLVMFKKIVCLVFLLYLLLIAYSLLL